MQFYSQDGQDKFLTEELFFNKKQGFFVDIGANDGNTLSNTKLLELTGWKGVCIEPLPNVFKKLIKNRNCVCHNVAITNTSDVLEFLEIEGYSEMLSGLIDNYDPRHVERINNELSIFGGTSKKIEVKCTKFSDLITEYYIDYVSIDVEGSELQILESINFEKHEIFCFSVESNYDHAKLISFFEAQNYTLNKIIGADHFFVKNNKC